MAVISLINWRMTRSNLVDNCLRIDSLVSNSRNFKSTVKASSEDLTVVKNSNIILVYKQVSLANTHKYYLSFSELIVILKGTLSYK